VAHERASPNFVTRQALFVAAGEAPPLTAARGHDHVFEPKRDYLSIDNPRGAGVPEPGQDSTARRWAHSRVQWATRPS
jgi:hypothetical protein